ncbi:Ig-like domain-containing protein [Mycolicibacterium pulveris]|uniref:Ig-like domain-containing protein n=1 Tax=Mycolicibacterium pulveris TaxID=36813 RepID=UPI003CF0570E
MASHALPAGTTTGYARYVGRVGALAVALGIGAAIASAPGVAGATADSEASGAETSATTTGADVDAGGSLDPGAPQDEAQTPPSESASGHEDEPSDDSTAEPDPRDGTVQATGGLNTTVNGDPDADTDGDVDTDTDGTEDAEDAADTETDVTPTKSSDAVAPAFSDTRVQSLVMKYAGGVIRGGSEDPDDSTTQEVTDEPARQIAHRSKPPTATPETAPASGVPDPVEDLASIAAVLPSPVAPVTPAQAPLLLLSALNWMRRTLFNTTPNALNDTAVTEVNTTQVIDVLANDEDEEGNSVRVTGFTQPENGTVTLSADGTFTYVPDEGFNGVDTFTYSVADRGFNIFRDPLRMLTGQGPRTDTATVSLYVGDVAVEPPSKVVMNLHMRQNLGTSVLSPDGTRLYISRGEAGEMDNIVVIDTGTNREVGAVVGQRNVTAMVFSPDGKRLYVANTFALKRYVSVIDTATNKEIATLDGVIPDGSIAINADGTRLYIFNVRDTIDVVDTSTNKVVGNIPLIGGVVFNPDRSRMYVISRTAVSILDPVTHKVTSTFDMPTRFTNVAFSPDGTRLYLGNERHDVVAMDAVTGKVLGAVNTGGPPVAVAASPDGKRVYATSSNFRGIKPKLTVIDTATFKVVTTIPMDWYPVSLSITPDSKTVYVSINKDKRLAVVA